MVFSATKMAGRHGDYDQLIENQRYLKLTSKRFTAMGSSFNNKKSLFLIIGFIIIAFFAGVFLQNQKTKVVKIKEQEHRELALKKATLLKTPRPIQPFKLLDMNEKPFTNQNLKGRWSLVFFGFTHCPMVCPTALSTLNKMYNQLEKDKVEKLPQVIFVSVDPARDTPKVIEDYLSGFNTNFLGVTGEKEEIDKLAKDFSAMYMKVMPEHPANENDYMIDHSAAVLVVNPEGDFYALFSSPTHAEDMAADLEKIMQP